MATKKSKIESADAPENIYYATFENSREAIFISGKDNYFSVVNKAAETLTGYSKQELLKMSVRNLCDPMELQLYQKYSDRLVAGDEVTYEVLLRMKDGSHVPAELHSKRIIIGNIPFIYIVAEDLTRSRLIEDSRRKTEQNLECIIHHSPDTIYVLDIVNHTCKYLNKEEFCGYSRSELENKDSLLNMIHPDDKSAVLANWQELLHSNNTLVTKAEYRLKRKDGQWEWIQQRGSVFSFMADGTPMQLLITLSIITDRKQMEVSLLSSEKQYRTLFNSIDEGFCIVEVIFGENDKPLDYRFLEVNMSFEKQTGLIDAQGKRMRELAPLHEEYWFEIYRHIALTGEPMRFRRYAEQLHRWYEVYAFRYGDKKKRQVAILFNDITERNLAENKILEIEGRYRLLSEQSGIGIGLYSPKGEILYFNNQALRNLGGKTEEYTGKLLTDVFGEQKGTEYLKRIRKAIRTGKSYDYEDFVQNPSGGYWFLSNHMRVCNPKGKVIGVQVLSHDITERKRMEEKIEKSAEEYRTLVQHIEEEMENERTHIARDLHDDLGQKLTVLNMDLSWLKSRIGVQSLSVENKLNEMVHLLTETMESIKKISFGLRPSILDDLGIREAIELQLKEFHKSTRIKYSFFWGSGEMIINKKISITVFRIMQEALTNVVRHSGATEVSLNFISDKNKLKFIFTDNGRGIEEDQILSPKSFGLIGMMERAKSCGGDLIIKGVKGKITQLVVTIPITREK